MLRCEFENVFFSSVRVCSYAESVDLYLDEEELRYYMPLKEYLSYCDSLRYMWHMTHNIDSSALAFSLLVTLPLLLPLLVLSSSSSILLLIILSSYLLSSFLSSTHSLLPFSASPPPHSSSQFYISPSNDHRAMVRRHDLLEKKLERAETNLSAKAEAKATVQREVL